MELNEQELDLIERYLDGQLAAAELQQMQQRLESDVAFAEAVEVQKDLRVALHQAGRNAMKAHIGAIGATVIAEGAAGVNQYKPSGRDSGAPGTSTFLTIGVVVVALAGALVWQTLNQPEAAIPAPPPLIEDTLPKTETPPVPEPKKITVPKEPKVQHTVTRKETILTRFQVIKGETIKVDEGRSYLDTLPTETKVIRRDTVIKVEPEDAQLDQQEKEQGSNTKAAVNQFKDGGQKRIE